MFFLFPVFGKCRQLAAQIDQILIALGPVAKERELFLDRLLRLGCGGFQRENTLGHVALLFGFLPRGAGKVGERVRGSCVPHDARRLGLFRRVDYPRFQRTP